MALSKVLHDRKVVPEPPLSFEEVQARLVVEFPCLKTRKGGGLR